MLSISLSLPGSKLDLEVLCLNMTVAHHRVHSRAMLRLLVRAMEQTERSGRQLHNILIWSLRNSPTHYKPQVLTKKRRALLKPRTFLTHRVLTLLRVKNALRPFQSDIS